MTINNFDIENFSNNVDRTIEKWCKERGIKKKFLFDSGIITSTGWDKAIKNQSLRVKTLQEIATFFNKNILDFFTIDTNVVNESFPVYSKKTESELLFELRDQVRNLQKEIAQLKLTINQITKT